ncbi:gliding-associated protein 45, putative [Perkinsus marinus ATCC 50983]|uniref:Gliding-associated protein 45, putative n=1 Tax=Perkinsus marinus (strain ATCC 50983 / TXsc) TaxID=423536 RepID=C5KLD6_PERM5|nr:gliding-associated protein 45, putative [Perkinsus marinus ATCC 50983]EER14707.1 gliding-associated protein 45, putative [Perkinsus marinus ATCC 50983]|eukprot:XP_002782911.1 gliding-associated protein 45, putative [Perkinsus marinus ATCC 50983]
MGCGASSAATGTTDEAVKTVHAEEPKAAECAAGECVEEMQESKIVVDKPAGDSGEDKKPEESPAEDEEGPKDPAPSEEEAPADTKAAAEEGAKEEAPAAEAEKAAEEGKASPEGAAATAE